MTTQTNTPKAAPVATAVSAATEVKALGRQLAAVKRQQADLHQQELEISARLTGFKVRAIQEQYTDKAAEFSVVFAYTSAPEVVQKVTIKNIATAKDAQAVAKKLMALKLGAIAVTTTSILQGRKKVMVYTDKAFKGCFPEFKKDGWYWVSESVAANK